MKKIIEFKCKRFTFCFINFQIFEPRNKQIFEKKVNQHFLEHSSIFSKVLTISVKTNRIYRIVS